MVEKRFAFLLTPFLFVPGFMPAASAGGISPLLSESVLTANFGAAPVLTELPEAGEPVLTPLPDRGLKGDFTAVPEYSFGYLNDLVVKSVDASARSVEIAIFSVTMKDIPDALMKAKARGAAVRIIIDEAHVYPRMDTQIKRMIQDGLDVRTLRGTRAYGVMHNKITIHDGEMVSVGSYNWTFGATFSSHENMTVARHPVYVDGYKRYFEWMWSHARPIAAGPSAEVPQGAYGAPPRDPSPVMSLNGQPVPAYIFSPGGGAQEELARLIDACRKSVDTVTYTFSSKTLADAVIRAKNRGVRVRFMIDEKRGAEAGLAKYLLDNGVNIKFRGGRNEKGAMHSKYVILDGQLLQTGSFNWTVNASVNSFENMMFVSDPGAVSAYQQNFDWLFSGAYTPSQDNFDLNGAKRLAD
ncbi:MAG: phospholipase D/transphosphatidylase [Elusimicrobia bacterium]|nr:MAG: phospholipase D/transphosphatidylase [Elusimicrobiota bacterium]KAF0154573.1 MAG: phospholipase D/transphosphatidylase [Elusimicrobiota bacterium]